MDQPATGFKKLPFQNSRFFGPRIVSSYMFLYGLCGVGLLHGAIVRKSPRLDAEMDKVAGRGKFQQDVVSPLALHVAYLVVSTNPRRERQSSK